MNYQSLLNPLTRISTSLLQQGRFLLLALAMLGLSCRIQQSSVTLAPTVSSTAQQAPREMVLLQVNDVYEIAALEGGKVGGMPRVAQLRKELLNENPHTFTVLAGDFLSPSVIGTVKLDGERIRGAHMIDVMNATGIDFVTFGNHEFDISESDLQKRLNESDFEWISSNVLHKTKTGTEAFYKLDEGDKFTFPQHQIVYLRDTYDGKSLRVGIIAVTLPFNKVPYVEYLDFIEAAKNSYEKIKPDCDFVVAITHLEIYQDRELAKAIPGLSLIMGGHDHENMFEEVAGVPIAKADANAKSAYIHRISFTAGDEKASVKSELKLLNETVSEDPSVAEVVRNWEQKAYRAFQEQGFDLNSPVASLKEPLDGLESHIRDAPTNLGIAIATAMYVAAEDADLAILNSGSVRIDDYLSGNITEFDIIRTLPFGGKIVKADMKGALVKRILEAGLLNKGTGGFLQTAQVTQNSDQKWEIGGKVLDPEARYRVAIPEFLMMGREANLEFLVKDHPQVMAVWEPGTADILRDIRLVLVEYLKKL